MAVDYAKYLATNVVNEHRIVTYRTLSRALKVHSNLAKQMLYAFHQKENERKKGSVNATYLISGIRNLESVSDFGADDKTKSNGKDGDDDVMASSPFMSSSMPQGEDDDENESNVPIVSIVLVREEDFEDVKASFKELSSVHIYSLQSAPLLDMHALSHTAWELKAACVTEDLVETGPRYGMIRNQFVQRRTGRHPPPAPAPVVAPKQAAAQAKAQVKAEPAAPIKKESASASSTQSSKSAAKPALKRDNSSLFKAFEKSKTKPKTDAHSAAIGSATAAADPVSAEDTPMEDVPSDDDEEEEHVFLDTNTTSGGGKLRQARKDREEKLRQMFDSDDEDEEMADTEKQSEHASVKQETSIDAEPETKPDPIKSEEASREASAAPPPSTAVVVGGGRRRGRRQVMKKKMIKDEEGYLVTKEEPVWESFSESEPEQPKAKVQVPLKRAASGAAKAGAGGAGKGKAGQGNIMSFFAKK